MGKRVYLGVDLGAESGRVIAGVWNGRKLTLEEVHRFCNGPVHLAGSLRWDTLRLWGEIQTGLAMAARKHGKSIVSVGADTWGVDYVLLNKRGEMLGQPYAYRDARTNGVMEKAFKKVTRAEIFQQTGLQFMQLNTLFQLIAHQQAHPELLQQADLLLLTPDFIHWALCGSKVVEWTNGTTTQCMHPVKRNWSLPLLKQFGIPTHIFPKIVNPGASLGSVRPELAERIGLQNVKVVAPPTHDTASAVAGVPTANTGRANWAYLSSGTWSLMGVEVQKPSLTERTRELNMTNEGGVDGTYRLLKNIMGLWLVQQCKRSFERKGRNYSYAELEDLATKASALRSIVDVNDPGFLNPPDMPQAMQDYCRRTDQKVPKSEGELVRCAYESLALKYREVLHSLEELTGETIEVIHIVGGGSKGDALNQFAADACQRTVKAGPVEATAMGNLLTQVRASGELGSLSECRDIVRRSSDLRSFEPGSSAAWDDAVEKLKALKAD